MQINLEKVYTVFQAGEEIPHGYTGDEIVTRLNARMLLINSARYDIEALEAKIEGWSAQMRPYLQALDATPETPYTSDQGAAFIQPEQGESVWETDGLEGLIKADRYKYGFLARFRNLIRRDAKVVVL